MLSDNFSNILSSKNTYFKVIFKVIVFNGVEEDNKCSNTLLQEGEDSWAYFDKYRVKLLNLISVDEFKATYQ
jgi:hypothetical protein